MLLLVARTSYAEASKVSVFKPLHPALNNNSAQRMPVPPQNLSPRVLLLGASTRAAAYSARRAGLQPVCADLFADADLRQIAEVLPVVDYPRGLIAAERLAPPCPFLYTGALENHPALVAELCKARELWGTGAETLRRVRNPWVVEEALRAAGLPCPAIWPDDGTTPPRTGGWMLKPCRGSAGRGIRVWSAESGGGLREPHYFQERRTGLPVSAIFLAVPMRTIFIGLTRQLIGCREARAPSFAYCGSIAPCWLPQPATSQIERIGQSVGAAFKLRGLFGCDFIVDAEAPWLTEINPRYTASIEVMELALRVPLLDWHRRACAAFAGDDSLEHELDMLSQTSQRTTARVAGKIVLYADRAGIAEDWLKFPVAPAKFQVPLMADIPTAGQQIVPGQPICTLFAAAESADRCQRKLLRRAERFYARML